MPSVRFALLLSTTLGLSRRLGMQNRIYCQDLRQLQQIHHAEHSLHLTKGAAERIYATESIR